MAARYQHVTDTMRSQVASQVGELIWDSASGNDDQATLVVRRGSLATVLAAAEDCLATHRDAAGQRPVSWPRSSTSAPRCRLRRRPGNSK